MQVDACLTSTEVISLIDEKMPEGSCLASYAEREDIYLDMLNGDRDDGMVLYGVPGGSGGWLEYIYRTAARRLFDLHVPEGPLPMRMLRNSNFKVCCILNVH